MFGIKASESGRSKRPSRLSERRKTKDGRAKTEEEVTINNSN